MDSISILFKNLAVKRKILAEPGFEPRADRWDAIMLPLCYAAPPPIFATLGAENYTILPKFSNLFRSALTLANRDRFPLGEKNLQKPLKSRFETFLLHQNQGCAKKTDVNFSSDWETWKPPVKVLVAFSTLDTHWLRLRLVEKKKLDPSTNKKF